VRIEADDDLGRERLLRYARPRMPIPKKKAKVPGFFVPID
jgi:hypothetical protein